MAGEYGGGPTMRILAGDVGGTKTLLQLIDIDETRRTVVDERRLESGAFASFDELLSSFLAATRERVDAACFAVAGPVIHGQAEITNLSWKVDAARLTAHFGFGRVALINDFYAVALGVPRLQRSDLLSLNKGKREPHAPIAILGAGTGLGEAFLVHDGARWIVIPCEGGHADFAPQDEEQTRLFLHLHAQFGHVSWERLLSGMGLVNIHNFLSGQERAYDESIPADLARLADGGDELARRTFDLFVDIYGAEAGNVALKVLARGGVFLAGGIAAKNVDRFTDGRFVEAFTRKGRFRALMEEIPVDLVVNANVGLLGAAEMAVELLSA